MQECQAVIALTWLFCCCWSLSCRIAWASPPVALLLEVSAERARVTSSAVGAVEPLAPCLSLRRPRLARTHMGYTDTADILNMMQLVHSAWVERTNEFDWLRLLWLAGRESQSDPRIATRLLPVLECRHVRRHKLLKVPNIFTTNIIIKCNAWFNNKIRYFIMANIYNNDTKTASYGDIHSIISANLEHSLW